MTHSRRRERERERERGGDRLSKGRIELPERELKVRVQMSQVKEENVTGKMFEMLHNEKHFFAPLSFCCFNVRALGK